MPNPDPSGGFLLAAKRLTLLLGFPRSNRLAPALAECATILEGQCIEPSQAQETVSRYKPARWISVEHFDRFVRSVVNPGSDDRAVQTILAVYRDEANLLGCPEPEIDSATPFERYERVVEWVECVEARILQEIYRAPDSTRRVLKAAQIAGIWADCGGYHRDATLALPGDTRTAYIEWATKTNLILAWLLDRVSPSTKDPARWGCVK